MCTKKSVRKPGGHRLKFWLKQNKSKYFLKMKNEKCHQRVQHQNTAGFFLFLFCAHCTENTIKIYSQCILELILLLLHGSSRMHVYTQL